MKLFYKKVLIMFLIVISVVSLLNYAYMLHSVNCGTMGECKYDSAYIIDVPNNIQICNFGNSHGYFGFNYEAYTKDYICYNFSLPSQSMSYNYRILQNYKENLAPGAIVFICVSYTSFFGEKETNETNFLEKNKRYYHFLDKKYIKEYDIKTDIFVNYLPSLTTGIADLAQTVIGVNRSEDMWGGSTNKEAATEYGPARYESHVVSRLDDNGNRIFNEEEIDSTYKMIELCKEINATPILITTPYLAEYTDAVENDSDFFRDFYGVITHVEKDTGVEYLDYQFDDRFRNKYEWFIDTDHLNKTGAANFTDIVMKDIIEKGDMQ